MFEHVASQSETRAQLLEHVRRGGDAIVEDVTYCDPDRRPEFEAELLAVSGVKIIYVCFENDRTSADSNVVNRVDKQGGGSVRDHLRYNRDLERRYTYPAGAEILPIHAIPPRYSP